LPGSPADAGVPAKEKLKSLGEDKDTTNVDYDYEYDEKHKTVAPTEPGVEKAEKFLGVDNLYVSEHGTLVNHLVQSLKAESLFLRDDDYAVIDGEVKIVDEFTGRIMEGRRWSEGSTRRSRPRRASRSARRTRHSRRSRSRTTSAFTTSSAG
jgi:preprotein translocase subunit SecA